MLDTTTPTIWLSVALGLITCTSFIILSFQRIWLLKKQQTDVAPLRFDHKRIFTNPIPDSSNRLTRLSVETFILAALSGLNFYNVVTFHRFEKWTFVASYCIQFIAWLYAMVLVLVSYRYNFPNEWGWILNVHLCIFYTMTWFISIYNIYETAALEINSTWVHVLPTIIFLLLGTDLVYTTATVPKGPAFLDENDKPVASINVASIYSFFYFNWVTPLINLAFKNKTLEDDNLPTLPPLFRAYNLYYIFGDTRGNSLWKRIYISNKQTIIIQTILSTITSLAYYVPTYFLNQLLALIKTMNGVKDDISMRKGIVIVTSLGVSIFVLGIAKSQLSYYASYSAQVRIKSMLNIEIYRKTLRRPFLADEVIKVDDKLVQKKKKKKSKADKNAATGNIVNLMSTDSNNISELSIWWYFIFSSPIEIAVGVYFLYSLLGNSCLFGFLVMVIIFPLNHYNSKWLAKTQEKLMKSRDKRVSLTNEVLQGIRQIKFFAWEKNWEKRIMDARNTELHYLGMTYLANVFFTFLWQGAPIIATVISFWSFTKIEGKDLDATVAFTAIAIFSQLKFALSMLPESFSKWVQALISARRIQSYLDEPEIDQVIIQNDDNIGFENATVGWSQNDYKCEVSDEQNNVTTSASSSSFILKDLNLKFPNNELSLISGSTGSGKTLLMLSLLREAVILKGSVNCPRQSIADSVSVDFIVSNTISPKDWLLPYALAYTSQNPWLQHASIRDNILFGLPYIKSRYRDTLYACALDKDLKFLEDGDQTEVGEKGITLSGGQKARISLARAVYSRAQSVLMDDVLSAVDAHTAKHLYENCLLGPLMKGRTRVLITHHVKLCIKHCAYIAHIDGGRASFFGSPDDLRESGKLDALIEHEETEDSEDITDVEDVTDAEESEEEKTVEEVDFSAIATETEKKKTPRTLVKVETRATGMVKFRHYKMYIKMVGGIIFWSIISILVLGSRGLDIVESSWVKKWSHSYENTNESNSLNFYLGIYCLITVSNIAIGTARFAFLYWGVLGASKSLYAALLQRIFRAPLRFFDTTPIGRILNRFSKDFETIDSNIPGDFMKFVIQVIIVISSMLTVSSMLPIFLAPMFAVAITNIYLGAMFVSASRELKRMNSVSQSPLFSHFTETIIGVATVRAFGVTRQFLQDMVKCVDANARPLYYTWTVNYFISVRFTLTGAIINFFTGGIILFSVENMNASLAGFCLNFVLLFTDQTFLGIRKYTSLEMSFNAIERVVEFMEMEQEAPAITELRPSSEWPTKGEIEVNNLEIKYSDDLDPVLKGISFSVKAKEKIGVVGRTGSGKSTLALSFFRFLEASKGSIVIDGIDIKDLGTEDLRSNLTIIPQDPTLFSGSLRSNMDPFDQFSDADIFAALRRVHLLSSEDVSSTTSTISSDSDLDTVNSNVFMNLETLVTEGGQNFSQGQRQLLCLGRALLKSSRIVLMDEATASVDFETDKAIQKTISAEFAESTILCIAHRLHTVIEYDRILVLDQGEIVEYDSPLALINNSESAFYKMCRNSGEFDSLIALARPEQYYV